MAKKYVLALAAALCICIMPSFSAQAEKPKPASSAAPASPTASATLATPTTPASPASIEMEWQRLNETWQNLSKRQKEQLYKAREAVDKADCNFIDKAVECKLIDKQIGDRMKEHIKARTARIRQDGDIPMFRRGIRQKPQAS